MVVTYPRSSTQTCPCDINIVTNTADCSDRWLEEIPKCIPNTTERLDLSGNWFTEIEDNQFSNLTHLVYLELHSVGLETVKIHNNSFDGLSQLLYLSLKDTKVASYPLTVFKSLNKLEELNLQGSCEPKTCSKIHERFKFIHSLKKLYLDNFLVNHIGPGFSFLRNLEEVYFIGNVLNCNFSTLRTNIFENLRNSTISKISIGQCLIHYDILAGTFSHLRYLTVLELGLIGIPNVCYIRHNFYETGLENTNILHLHFPLKCQNDYNRPFVEVIGGLEHTPLESLNMSHGTVQGISGGFFFTLPRSMKYLFLHNNHIDSIELSLLHRLEHLITLDLSNQVDCIPCNEDINQTDFVSREQRAIDQKTSKLSTFSIGPSNISSNHTTDLPHKCSECWGIPPALEEIDISRSGLLCDVTKILCNSNNSLKILNSAYQSKVSCVVKLLHVSGSLATLQKLEKLDLSGNRIKTIPYSAFSGLVSLKHLILTHNSLGWPVISFNIQSMVFRTLNFSDNSIGTLSSEFTDHLDKISDYSNLIVDLSKNELVCNCNTFSFVAWLKCSKIVKEKSSLTCFDTDKLKETSNIDDIHEKLKYQCTKVEVVLGCVGGFLLLSLTLGIIELIWYKRWKLNYLLSIARPKITPYHRIGARAIEMKYDVYISYERDFNVNQNTTLHDFVTKRLYPELQRRGYKTFIRDELLGGTSLYDGISDIFQSCDKVIALISKDYCKDPWNLFEFNRAVMEGIYTRRQIMIPVAIDEISREHLSEEIFTFLNTSRVPYFSPKVTPAMFFSFIDNRLKDNRGFGASQE